MSIYSCDEMHEFCEHSRPPWGDHGEASDAASRERDAAVRISELEAENANFESGARCDRDEIEGLKAERDALRHARLPCRQAEVAQRRYEQAEAELAAVGSDLQDEAEYNIKLRERAERAEAEIERLKCCGNCRHWEAGLLGCEMDAEQEIVCEGRDRCKVFNQAVGGPREPCWAEGEKV